MTASTDFLEQQADLLFKNLAGWETRTLERIAKRINRTGKMNLADVKALNNIAVTKQEIDAIIKDLAQVTGKNIGQIQKIYGDVIGQEHDNNKHLYDYRNKPFVPFSNNTQLQALVRAYSKSTGETMINLSKTKALGFINEFGKFKNMQDSIYDVFGKAVMQVTTGSGDFTTAMRGAIEQLGSSGIRVHYGSGVNRRLDTVIRQNLLWGAKQASIEYNDMIGEELECDGIEIDFHSNPRPSHEFMQGMQYSLSGKKTVNGITYESADRALERLNDYGCLHFKTSIILGISEPRYSDEELAEMRRENAEPKTVDGVEKSGYEWTQDMRRLETEARKEKEIINSLKVAGDEEGARQHRKKLRTINEKYKAITDQTGLTPQKERMRVYGGTNNTNTLENSGESGIINNKDSFLGSIFDGNGYNPADIQRAITQESTNFVTTDIESLEYGYGIAIEQAKKIPGFYDIKAHGDYDGVKIFDSAVDASGMAKIIMLRKDYSGEPIRLLSCNTGKIVNGTCVAQELSNLLGVEVLAPNDVLKTNSKGVLVVGKLGGNGKFVCFRPK